ncbi:DUF3817 domain-containing protein [Flavobacterium sp.]|uniref:DUF3817 domain-containing protein n=1 Tax=Flavobacterium sp. TaxID=239 RepID=UPI003527A0ED
MLVIKPLHFELYKTLLFPIGITHGMLFIFYIVLATYFKFENKYSFKDYFIIGIASVPFGTFYIEKKYLSKLK